MRRWHGILRVLAGGIAAGFLVLHASSLAAEDRCDRFLKAILDRQYFDTAFDYLESMRTSPLVSPEFLEKIDCETGMVLMASADQLPSAEREKRLNEARSYFERFLLRHAQHPRALTASVNLGNLLVQRGRIKVDQATRTKRTPEEVTKLIEEARRQYREANGWFTDIEAELSLKHKEYRKSIDASTPEGAKLFAERDQIRIDILETRRFLGQVLFEIGKTYPPNSPEFKKDLTDAAKLFNEYSNKYSKFVASQYARIDEARCYKELGDPAKALELVGDMMSHAESDESQRRMRTAATVVALQTAVSPEVKRYEDALRMYDIWEKNIARRSEASKDALSVKMLAAKAAFEQARTLKLDDEAQQQKRRDLLTRAKELATFVAQYPSESQRDARLLLTDWQLGAAVKVEAPKTFEEARDRAKLATYRLQERDLSVEEELQLQAKALDDLRLAMSMAPADANIADLNAMRYSAAYLYYMTAEYYDAAVIGEFLARRYPDHPEATGGAKIAVKSYMKLIANARPDDDHKLENNLLMGIVRYIPERWPTSAAADEAWGIQIREARRSGELSNMLDFLDQVSPDAPQRGRTELVVGRALWSSYVDFSRRPEAEQPSKDEMAKIFARAHKTLEDGVGRMRKSIESIDDTPPDVAAATLSLAQICLDAGLTDKAIEWLDDPKIGAYSLVKACNPVTAQGNYRVEALKATLKAYVTARQFEKIEPVMKALEKATDSGSELARIYLPLAHELEEALKQSEKADDKQARAKLTKGFTAVLSRIAARPAGEMSFNVLSWTAEMFMNLGTAVDPGNWKPPVEAVEHYEKAAAVYRKILEICREKENYAPEAKSVSDTQVRLAHCLRRLGQYSQAMQVLVDALKVENNLVAAQREAACTYQAWGADKPANYLLAIKGGSEFKREDGSTGNLVWGWGGIARRVQSMESCQDLYHEARFNLTLCRLQYALSKVGNERTELLTLAQRDIVVVNKLCPDMGGKEWFDRYDALLKTIQKHLGQQETGLKAVEEKSAVAAP